MYYFYDCVGIFSFFISFVRYHAVPEWKSNHFSRTVYTEAAMSVMVLA